MLDLWLHLVDSFTSSVFVWQNDITSYFSVSLKSKVWSMLYHGSVGASSRQKHNFMFSSTLSGFCFFVVVAVVFRHKICVSIIFDSFLDEASNFLYRILTNQKQKFLVKKCQWKCMSQYFLNWNIHCRYYVDLTSFGIKKHVRLLLLRCFCILLLNWDIRVPPLCGIHIGQRKI